jgi:hypothetical protein
VAGAVAEHQEAHLELPAGVVAAAAEVVVVVVVVVALVRP